MKYIVTELRQRIYITTVEAPDKESAITVYEELGGHDNASTDVEDDIGLDLVVTTPDELTLACEMYAEASTKTPCENTVYGKAGERWLCKDHLDAYNNRIK